MTVPHHSEPAEAVAWLITHRETGHRSLEFKPPHDLPFNRERFSWEPLSASPAPAAGGLEAVRELVQACYDEMHGPQCNEEPDDEHVASCLDADGKVAPAGRITFGMIRRAVAALASPAATPVQRECEECSGTGHTGIDGDEVYDCPVCLGEGVEPAPAVESAQVKVRRDDPFRPAVDVDADDDYYPSREDD